jgi:HSP90 family molecular chaperone
MITDYNKIAEENIKKYGTDIGRYGPVLLAHLYSDRTHFIYEILQNAEDAGAKINKKIWINFHLFKDRLEIRHNGKLFDHADVQGICGLVEGTKNNDLTQIGKFGIGFKSVYAYTNTPKVYSGNEAFCIENYVLPHPIDKVNDHRRRRWPETLG